MNDQALIGIGSTSQRRRDALVELLRDKGISNEAVLEVIRTTPRHLFLDEAMQHNAYQNISVPIGHGQTISQPYTVARMTEILLARSAKQQRILEIGTGSGYQTAVLAQLCGRIYSVERIEALQTRAQSILKRLGIRNVRYKFDDGHWGWSFNAPYDAILSAAAPESIPQTLLDQLAVGGCLISPVGGAEKQHLVCVTRDNYGFNFDQVEEAMFVPFLKGVE